MVPCLPYWDDTMAWILRFSRSGFFRLSRCPSYTWAHIKYSSSLCVCTRVTSTHPPTTRQNIEIYKTKPLSLPLPKHSLPRQQQAPTMDKLEKKNYFQSPPGPIHAYRFLKNTRDAHACSREIGQYKQTTCAYTSAYVHPHACVYTCICIHIHRHTCTHIHTYAHTHMHAYMRTHMHMRI